MKKTITMLLLTALCVTAFASCDLGNGLVAELFGDVKDFPIGEQIYPSEDYIVIETDIAIDIDPAVTWDEVYTESITPVVFSFSSVSHEFESYTEYAEYADVELMALAYSEGFALKPGQQAISFGGWVAAYSYQEIEMGYSVNGKETVYDYSFTRDLPEGAGEQIPNNISYAVGASIYIPTGELEDGYNEVALYCGRQLLFTVKVLKEAPTTLGEETWDVSVDEVTNDIGIIEPISPAPETGTIAPVPEDTTEVDEVETEIEPEIEFPEIDIDD